MATNLKRPPPPGDDLRNGTKRQRSVDPPSAPPKVSLTEAQQKKAAEAKARIAAMMGKLSNTMSKPSAAVRTPAPASASPTPPPSSASTEKEDRMKKLEQMRAARLAGMTAQEQGHYTPPPPTRGPPPPPPQNLPEELKSRGGLGISLHPALMKDAPEIKPQVKEQPKKNKGKGKKEQRVANPYLTESNFDELKSSSYYDPEIGIHISSRRTRKLDFSTHGKNLIRGEAVRREAKLEEIRKRAEEARRVEEDPFLVKDIPDMEWWDAEMFEGDSYDALDNPDSLNAQRIDDLIQHPVQQDPPQDKLIPKPKPLMLTQKERKKLRRQRRMADHKEEQAKIRLGLVPPPPPKIKKSNLMRVLGDQAVKDPTAVEVRVTREIEERRLKHERENEERKKTGEEKAAKKEENQKKDAEKGIHMSVFKVANLCNGKHRYQVDFNAKQDALTGVAILNPHFNVVIVEGGERSLHLYKKLMEKRIHWTDNLEVNRVREGAKMEDYSWLKNTDEEGNLKDLSDNKCQLIWGGEVRERMFKYWNTKIFEKEEEAKDFLKRHKLENMWTLADTFDE